jgi:hypothetical protein
MTCCSNNIRLAPTTNTRAAQLSFAVARFSVFLDASNLFLLPSKPIDQHTVLTVATAFQAAVFDIRD